MNTYPPRSRSSLRTFHWLAIPSRSHFRDRVRHRPIFVPDFDQSQRSLGSMPSCLEYIGTSSRHRILFACTNDDRLCADRRKPIDVGPDVELHNVVFSQRLRSEGIRATYDIIDSIEGLGLGKKTYARGEKWATALLTEIHVGKAMPTCIRLL